MVRFIMCSVSVAAGHGDNEEIDLSLAAATKSHLTARDVWHYYQRVLGSSECDKIVIALGDTLCD